ncbi:MAG: DUF1080 domain-containing protein [Planctomycetes bacterium]|nr:DUF1080 domain-containing protein [Planctomycetota bacterium]
MMNPLQFHICTLALLLLSASTLSAAEPFSGKATDYHGYQRYDMTVGGCKAWVVAPKQPAGGNPWIWRAEFFDHAPQVDLALLARGYHLAFITVGNTFGCPDAMKHWDAFYEVLTTRHGLAADPVLEGLSRGGLYVCNWASAHPYSVGCILLDNAVLDFKSWPGGKGAGPGSKRDWEKLLGDYHFRDEAEALAYQLNPIDNLAPLAAARVPIYFLYGDADEVVPFPENGQLGFARYEKLGGPAKLHLKPGGKHHPHGLDDPTPSVAYVMAATGQDETGFVPLLPSDDLAGWVEDQHDFYKRDHPNTKTWRLADGVLTCDGSTGNCGFLRYQEKLGNFTLRCEYQLSAGGNSGVGLLAPVPYTTLNPNTLPSNVGLELQLFDDQASTPSEQGNGSFYNKLAPREKIAQPAGRWHALEIEFAWPRLRARIDRHIVQDVNLETEAILASRSREGYLSLQNHGHDIQFRRLRIKRD